MVYPNQLITIGIKSFLVLSILSFTSLFPAPDTCCAVPKDEIKSFWRKKSFSAVPEFQGVPKGDDEGIVLRATKIHVPGSPHAYNPSIIRSGKGYLLAFRHEYWSKGDKKISDKKKSIIGLARLDKKCKVIGKPQYLKTHNHHSEDPRLFHFHGKPHVLFVQYMRNSIGVNRMRLGCIDESSLKIGNITAIPYGKTKVEKNWTPFVYTKKGGGQELYFLYRYASHEVLRFSPSSTDRVEHPFSPLKAPDVQFWEKKWGTIRGGTPAVLVDGEYLAFFHSSFTSEEHKWYAMGAATFESCPPFRMKKISQVPILFEKMYSSPVARVAVFYPRTNVHVIFPGGFVKGVKDGREVFHLVYGDNDSAIGVVTIDKTKLMNSLQPVEQSTGS